MAEKIISPGVFTQENDLSFLPQGISEIGAAIIGPTVKGPAFIPTIVESYNDFVQKFGPLSQKTYVPYTVQEYLQSSGRVTIVRVLGQTGYSLQQAPIVISAGVAASAGTYATASAVITGSLTDLTGQFYTINAGTETYNLIGRSNSGTTNGGTYYGFGTIRTFITSGSIEEDVHNLAKSINAVFDNISAKTGSWGAGLILSASSAGITANDYYLTGSYAFAAGGFAAGSDSTLNLQGGTNSSDGIKVVNVLHPSFIVTTDGANSLFEDTPALASNANGNFVLKISGSYSVDTSDFTGNAVSVNGTAYSCSINPTNNNYLGNIFGYAPDGTQPVYNYIFAKNQASRSLSADPTLASTMTICNATSQWDFTDEYASAYTPWVTSQKVNGSSKYNLFKLHTRSHGNSVNNETKIGITDIRVAGSIPGTDYGAFTLVVRGVDQSNIPVTPFTTQDSDTKPTVFETFDNLNLNPDSPNYIVRRIGDQWITTDANGKVTVNGDYTNKSAYIRVEVATGVDNKAVSAELLPFGFRSIWETIPNVAGYGNLPSASMVREQKINDVYNKKRYFGFDYDLSLTDNLIYLNPVPGTVSTGSNKDFYLGDYNQDTGANYPSSTSPFTGPIDLNSSNTSTDTRKFMLPFQGGFDGLKPNTQYRTGQYIVGSNSQGFDCSTVTAAGSVAYTKAINTISNQDEYDINMIVTPGVLHQYSTTVTIKAKDVCEDRGDCFYVMDDVALTANIATAVDTISTLDSNYVATYYPWVKIIDTDRNKPVWVPPSVVLPGVIAYTDKVSHEWFAPAGLNRGGLTSVVQAYDRLTHANRDTLYEGRVNPIASFPAQGVVVWGQKTLQGQTSALDRVNVRRLLIAVKKFIASSSRYLVFEQNSSTTRNRFLNIVNPYLESIQQRQGLYSFKVVMDESNNTPDVIDRNILKGDIYLQPTKTAEFIVLDFNILPTGASFPE